MSRGHPLRYRCGWNREVVAALVVAALVAAIAAGVAKEGNRHTAQHGT